MLDGQSININFRDINITINPKDFELIENILRPKVIDVKEPSANKRYIKKTVEATILYQCKCCGAEFSKTTPVEMTSKNPTDFSTTTRVSTCKYCFDYFMGMSQEEAIRYLLYMVDKTNNNPVKYKRVLIDEKWVDTDKWIDPETKRRASDDEELDEEQNDRSVHHMNTPNEEEEVSEDEDEEDPMPRV